MRYVKRCLEHVKRTWNAVTGRARRRAGRFSGCTVMAMAACLSPLPAVADGIVHFSTGIGDDDPIQIEMMRRLHNPQLVFALRGSGSYVAGVRVVIHDAGGGRVLATLSEGPLFFATLPAGRYRIETDFGARTQVRTTTVGPSGRRDLWFYWDGE